MENLQLYFYTHLDSQYKVHHFKRCINPCTIVSDFLHLIVTILVLCLDLIETSDSTLNRFHRKALIRSFMSGMRIYTNEIRESIIILQFVPHYANTLFMYLLREFYIFRI